MIPGVLPGGQFLEFAAARREGSYPAMTSISSIPTLSDTASWASAEEVALLELLLSENQAHLFESWKPTTDFAEKHAFCTQVCHGICVVEIAACYS